ncbi:MAG: ammonium transporter [Rhodospirillales bacterium]|nr:ammonium transporter [Rhodospirillales bacterium]
MTTFLSRSLPLLLAAAALGLGAGEGFAQSPPAAPPPKLDTGDTAWMLSATALVLLMTIPGLALFYGGMVRKKNVLAMMMQCFAVTCLTTVLWVVAGYSLAFADGGSLNAYIGGLSKAFLAGVDKDALKGSIPETVFMMFQLTFAIITPALIVGAFADRMKFSALLLFTGLWGLVVYAPIAHWVWGDGFLARAGVLDFAGGTVVHINAGIAGLVAAIVLGKRKSYGTENMAPHNLALSVVGAALLWVGWFGFNAGSATAANGQAGMAMAVTQIAAATAALTWMFVEWLARGKPSVLGVISGAVAGLVAITPAAGFITPMGALAIGGVAGIACYWGAMSLKQALGYDDSLDVFGIHGIGGIVGAILTGVFASKTVGETAGLLEGNGAQVMTQLWGIAGTIVWSGLASYLLLKIIDATVGLRVDEETEVGGLDLALHGESVH